LKKIIVISFFFILYTYNLFGQNVKKYKVDTTYTIDSTWQNDTLFLVRTMHLKVIALKDTTKTIDKTTYIYDDLLSYSFLAPNEIKSIKKERYSFFSNSKIHFKFDYGNFFYTSKSQNQFLDSTILPISLMSYGVLFEHSIQNFNYLSGFFYNNLSERFFFNDYWNNIDTSYSQKILINNYWNVDTIWFLNLDSLLVGDTVWFPYYDSTYITEIDTITLQNIDTTNFYKQYNNINKLQYIELPIILSYKINLKKLGFEFLTGIFFGFYLNPKYNIFLPHDYGVLSALFPKIIYSLYQSINIEYQISKKISFQVGFFCKIPISNYFSIFQTNRKPYSYGLSLGISYKIK
jgi:hypothetical protein